MVYFGAIYISSDSITVLLGVWVLGRLWTSSRCCSLRWSYHPQVAFQRKLVFVDPLGFLPYQRSLSLSLRSCQWPLHQRRLSCLRECLRKFASLFICFVSWFCSFLLINYNQISAAYICLGNNQKMYVPQIYEKDFVVINQLSWQLTQIWNSYII